MGMIVTVYKEANDPAMPLNENDCTNGGASSKYTSFVVTNIDGPFNPSSIMPAMLLVKGPYDTPRLIPVANKDDTVMFGGNYAGTSDSRFSKAVEKLTGRTFESIVKIFDRIEN